MKTTQRRAFARRAAALLALACAALDRRGAGAGAAASGRVPRPVIEKARGEACVADPAFMRLNHMDLLKHQRNETVHRGVRDPRASLKGCIECHASSATGSVAASTDRLLRQLPRLCRGQGGLFRMPCQQAGGNDRAARESPQQRSRWRRWGSPCGARHEHAMKPEADTGAKQG